MISLKKAYTHTAKLWVMTTPCLPPVYEGWWAFQDGSFFEFGPEQHTRREFSMRADYASFKYAPLGGHVMFPVSLPKDGLRGVIDVLSEKNFSFEASGTYKGIMHCIGQRQSIDVVLRLSRLK